MNTDHKYGLVYDGNGVYHRYCKKCNIKINTIMEYVKSKNIICKKEKHIVIFN